MNKAKKIIRGILATALVLSLVACGNSGGDNQAQGQEEVKLYFANNEYIISGDESLEKLMVEDRTIDVGEGGIGMAIFQELKKGPENQDASSLIQEGLQLHGVKFEDDAAYVDFDSDGLNGSSLEEHFTILQIVNSILSLEDIDRVYFLVDGSEAESLMGHEDISSSFDTIME